MIELMVALVVLAVGITAILSLQVTAMQASAYSRHATEAAVLGEDKMEDLRTVPIASLANGSETGVNAEGESGSGGLYARSWQVSWNGSIGTITVTVQWLENGDEPHAEVFRTERSD